MGFKPWMIGPTIVGVILCSSLVSVSTLIIRANTDPNFAVEPDYYNHALKWDETAAQLAQNARMGWTVEVSSATLEGASDRAFVSIVLVVRDGLGELIPNAEVDFISFHNARAKAKQRVSGVAGPIGDPGNYRVSFAGELAGAYQLRLRVEANDRVFTWSDSVEVASSTTSAGVGLTTVKDEGH